MSRKFDTSSAENDGWDIPGSSIGRSHSARRREEKMQMEEEILEELEEMGLDPERVYRKM